jgi:hypothetical protein
MMNSFQQAILVTVGKTILSLLACSGYRIDSTGSRVHLHAETVHEWVCDWTGEVEVG